MEVASAWLRRRGEVPGNEQGLDEPEQCLDADAEHMLRSTTWGRADFARGSDVRVLPGLLVAAAGDQRLRVGIKTSRARRDVRTRQRHSGRTAA